MAQKLLDRRHFHQGHQIFAEGEEGREAYLVQSGVVEVTRAVDGVEKVIGRIGKGGMFGEMALIDDKPRMAKARAMEATTVIVISRPMFEQKISHADPFLRGLIKVLSGHVRSLTNGGWPKFDAGDPEEAQATKKKGE